MSIDPAYGNTLHHAHQLQAECVNVVVECIQEVQAKVGGEQSGCKEGHPACHERDGRPARRSAAATFRICSALQTQHPKHKNR